MWNAEKKMFLTLYVVVITGCGGWEIAILSFLHGTCPVLDLDTRGENDKLRSIPFLLCQTYISSLSYLSEILDTASYQLGKRPPEISGLHGRTEEPPSPYQQGH